MKTMLLTSAGMEVNKEILKILPKPPKELKLTHITTASIDEKNKDYFHKETQIMKELGFQVTEADISGMTEGKVRKLLKDTNIIYVQGGNTYYLLKSIKESGFDKVVKELLEKGVIYIGVSAGSYVAGPTIEQADWIHEHNRFGLTDLTAMNLVPFLLMVHYVPEYKSILKEKIQKSKYEFKILTDDQAILVKGDNYKLVGKGPEINI
ncbi:Type 1 glutamine amidotransferase-like domain-containing protein [Patescibacteria group bacterium]|nr:Type 1 glutamine amidotransferase-like domain-containing protein [Patescibacteria group bacterium]